MEIDEILQVLPHKHPYLLVDRVVETIAGEKIVAIKGVTYSENIFIGHFPEVPILPGAMIIEAASQVAGLLVYSMNEEKENKLLGYVTEVKEFKFRKKVKPGNLLIFEATKEMLRGPFLTALIKVSVDDTQVAEGKLQLYIDKN